MTIREISLADLKLPLARPLRYAGRDLPFVPAVVVKIQSDTGMTGYGEAPPAATGESRGSVAAAVKEFISPAITGLDLDSRELILTRLEQAVPGNPAAKSAVDMALHDLYAKSLEMPLYQVLGGYRRELETAWTLRADELPELIAGAQQAAAAGYSTLKLVLGPRSEAKGFPESEIGPIREVRNAAGGGMQLRVDGGQRWSVKEALAVIGQAEEEGLNIQWFEQPVPAEDLDGLRRLTQNLNTPIAAGCLATPQDARRVLEQRAADVLVVELSRVGGIRNALRILELADVYGVPAVISTFLESKIGQAAALHLAAAHRAVHSAELAAPGFFPYEPIHGGPAVDAGLARMSEDAGLGVSV